MKKKLIVLLTLLSALLGHAQNWHGVPLNDTTYYLSKNKNSVDYTYDTNLVRAIFITVIQPIGTDTSYNFFHSLRPFYPPTTCLDSVNSPSWMGPKVVRTPIGVEHYYNYRDDVIEIQTYAPLNATWKISTDTSGLEYWGTVNQITVDTIDGQPDSIKHIAIQVKQNNLSVSHDYNGRVIQLSKNHGFLSVFEWYAFPYFYVYNNILPIDTSMHQRIPRAVTEKDYSKIDFTTMYQPGTYWQIHDSLTHTYFLYDTWIQDSVLSMSLLTPTTAEVHFKRIEVVHNYRMIEPPSQTHPSGVYLDTVYTLQYLHTDTISDPYLTVDRSIRKAKIPERFESLVNSSPFGSIAHADRLYFKSYTDQMRTIYDSDNWWDWSITTPPLSACYQINGGTSGNKRYSLGYLPQLNFIPGYYYVVTGTSVNENDDYFTLIFYKDQLQTYGTPVDVSTLSTTQLQRANSISIYPNPSITGIFHIGLSGNIKWSAFTLDGKHIKSGIQQEVNLHEQKQGIYLLKIETSKSTYYSKLIIQ